MIQEIKELVCPTCCNSDVTKVHQIKTDTEEYYIFNFNKQEWEFSYSDNFDTNNDIKVIYRCGYCGEESEELSDFFFKYTEVN